MLNNYEIKYNIKIKNNYHVNLSNQYALDLRDVIHCVAFIHHYGHYCDFNFDSVSFIYVYFTSYLFSMSHHHV